LMASSPRTATAALEAVVAAAAAAQAREGGSSLPAMAPQETHASTPSASAAVPTVPAAAVSAAKAAASSSMPVDAAPPAPPNYPPPDAHIAVEVAEPCVAAPQPGPAAVGPARGAEEASSRSRSRSSKGQKQPGREDNKKRDAAGQRSDKGREGEAQQREADGEADKQRRRRREAGAGEEDARRQAAKADRSRRRRRSARSSSSEASDEAHRRRRRGTDRGTERDGRRPEERASALPGEPRRSSADRDRGRRRDEAKQGKEHKSSKDRKGHRDTKESRERRDTKESRDGVEEPPPPGQQGTNPQGPPPPPATPPPVPFTPGTPEAARLDAARAELARLAAAGQAPPPWLSQQVAYGNAAQAAALATAAPGASSGTALTPEAAVAKEARKASMEKARRAAPPPPWMAAKAVFGKADRPAEGTAPAAGAASTAGATAVRKQAADRAHSSTRSNSAPGSPSAEAAGKKRKLDLGDVSSLMRTLSEERSKLRLFVIKAKQDYEERKERQGSGQDHEPAGETDKQEYYSAQPGEELGPDRSLKVEAQIGRGVFSSVVQCKDTKDNKEYAVKFIRANTMMRRAAEKEVDMYKRLAKDGRKEDPEGARFLINLMGCGTFEHAGHYCLLFELLRCDMRFAVQKYGQGGGLPLPALVQYTRQLFQALRVLQRMKVIHADLKPDNLLMTMNKAEVQICDFGSAMDVAEQVRTAYAQPRYYRAPEVILGLPYDTQIDIWSAGATIFELATGRILFTGKTNNAMLKQIIDVCGGFPRKMTQDGEFSKKHFSSDGDFLLKDVDSITGLPEILPSMLARPPRPVLGLLQATLVAPSAGVSQAVHDKWVVQLAELVSRCLTTDPERRIEPAQALDLPFFAKRQ